MDTVETYKAMVEDLLQLGEPEDNFFLQSLEASAFLHDNPQPYLEAFEEATAPAQTQLDIHLTGPGIHGHTADADEVGLFLRYISAAAKSLAKDLMGSSTFSPQAITIEGFRPGSLRMVLNAPPPKVPRKAVNPKNGEEIAPVEEIQNIESEALWTLASVLTEPAGEPGSGVDDVILPDVMSPKTRKSLSGAVGVLKKNNWEIEGETSLRGYKKHKVELTARGVSKLSEALKQEKPMTTPQGATGSFTGHKAWTRGELYFKAETGKEITLKTHNNQLLKQAADLAKEKQNRVTIYYLETQVLTPDGREIPSKVTYELTSIKPYRAYIDGEQVSLEI